MPAASISRRVIVPDAPPPKTDNAQGRGKPAGTIQRPPIVNDNAREESPPSTDLKKGGFTGRGKDKKSQKFEPAGVVHEDEYVIPKEVVDALGQDFIDRLDAEIVRITGTKPHNMDAKVEDDGYEEGDDEYSLGGVVKSVGRRLGEFGGDAYDRSRKEADRSQRDPFGTAVRLIPGASGFMDAGKKLLGKPQGKPKGPAFDREDPSTWRDSRDVRSGPRGYEEGGTVQPVDAPGYADQPPASAGAEGSTMTSPTGQMAGQVPAKLSGATSVGMAGITHPNPQEENLGHRRTGFAQGGMTTGQGYESGGMSKGYFGQDDDTPSKFFAQGHNMARGGMADLSEQVQEYALGGLVSSLKKGLEGAGGALYDLYSQAAGKHKVKPVSATRPSAKPTLPPAADPQTERLRQQQGWGSPTAPPSTPTPKAKPLTQRQLVERNRGVAEGVGAGRTQR